MALYYCKQPGCPGHDTFSKTCPPAVIPDYEPLVSFQKLLETHSLEYTPSIQNSPTPVTASDTAKAYFNFWRE